MARSGYSAGQPSRGCCLSIHPAWGDDGKRKVSNTEIGRIRIESPFFDQAKPETQSGLHDTAIRKVVRDPKDG